MVNYLSLLTLAFLASLTSCRKFEQEKVIAEAEPYAPKNLYPIERLPTYFNRVALMPCFTLILHHLFSSLLTMPSIANYRKPVCLKLSKSPLRFARSFSGNLGLAHPIHSPVTLWKCLSHTPKPMELPSSIFTLTKLTNL